MSPKPWKGIGLVIVAAALVPLLIVASVADGGDGVRASTKRVIKSAIDSVAGPMLEERGLKLVEGHWRELRAAALEFDVPVELLAGIMFAESRGRGGQTSSQGALGLMQLVLAAARDAGKRAGIELPADKESLRKALLTDDQLNIRLGAAHLSWLLEHRGAWSDEAVLVSYNAGRARLFQWIEASGSYGGWVASEEVLAARGKRNTGALDYARDVLQARQAFRERGRLGSTGPDVRPE